MTKKTIDQRLEDMKKSRGVVPTNFYMPHEMKTIIKHICKMRNMSVTKFIETALMEYLEKVEENTPPI